MHRSRRIAPLSWCRSSDAQTILSERKSVVKPRPQNCSHGFGSVSEKERCQEEETNG